MPKKEHFVYCEEDHKPARVVKTGKPNKPYACSKCGRVYQVYSSAVPSKYKIEPPEQTLTQKVRSFIIGRLIV